MESLKLFGFYYKVYDSENEKRIGMIDIVATDPIQVIGCGYEVLYEQIGDDIRVDRIEVISCTTIGNLRARCVYVAPNDYTPDEVAKLMGITVYALYKYQTRAYEGLK